MSLPSGSSWNSLERRLPLLIGGLVVVSVLATFAVVRLDLRESAIDGANERLARVSEQIAQLAATGTAQRREQVLRAAASPALVAALRGDAVDPGDAFTALERLRLPADTGQPILLVDRSGNVLLRTDGAADARQAHNGYRPADTAPGGAEGRRPAVLPAGMVLADTVTESPLHGVDGRGAFWSATPVRDGTQTVGHVVQRRAVGSPAARRQVAGLVGASIEIALANREGPLRVLLDGTVLDDTADITETGAVFDRAGSDGRRYHSYAAPVPGTGWMVVADMPIASVTARATEVKRRLLVVGGLLLLLGGVAAWLVSRRVTLPLRRLTAAADAIAAGDYSRRTGIRTADELGHLARSFDAMAGRVEGTHAQLEKRFGEARRLAAELEVTNARLQQVVSELELARSEAQEASAAKSAFLATMSHEIRTPINAMVGYTDLLELGVSGPLNERQGEFVSRIRVSAEHLISIVNDVLDFAKIESGQMRIGHEVLSPVAVVREAFAMMQAQAAERGVRLRMEGRHDPRLLGDRQRLYQILLNLLSNALKFTPEGGTVTVTCEPRASRACPPVPGEEAAQWSCVIVRDTGVGIPPDQRELIFEPFVQGTAGYTRPYGGTGLGLAISRSLARMMGGDLTLESEPGRGATFTVWLPAAVSAHQHA